MIRIICKYLAFGLFAMGCASDPQQSTAGRRVIDQSPGMQGLPAWATKGNRFQDTEGKVAFKGMLTMEPDARGDACTHAAGTDAKGRIAALVSSSILDQAGISGDERTTVSNRLTVALAKQKFSGVEIADEYWALIEFDDGMNKNRRLECFAKVTIDKRSLDNAIAKAMREVRNDPAVKEHRARLDEGMKKLEKQEGMGE
ncbi:MAG TPA: hypothetical protein V6C65_28970 [Allocoleopsis sp.]